MEVSYVFIQVMSICHFFSLGTVGTNNIGATKWDNLCFFFCIVPYIVIALPAIAIAIVIPLSLFQR